MTEKQLTNSSAINFCILSVGFCLFFSTLHAMLRYICEWLLEFICFVFSRVDMKDTNVITLHHHHFNRITSHHSIFTNSLVSFTFNRLLIRTCITIIPEMYWNLFSLTSFVIVVTRFLSYKLSRSEISLCLYQGLFFLAIQKICELEFICKLFFDSCSLHVKEMISEQVLNFLIYQWNCFFASCIQIFIVLSVATYLCTIVDILSIWPDLL